MRFLSGRLNAHVPYLHVLPQQIRVNCISPGHIRTRMTSVYLDENPHLLSKWSGSNPLGRIGRSAEMRGVAVWLASSASSFWCVQKRWDDAITRFGRLARHLAHPLSLSLSSPSSLFFSCSNGSDVVVSGGHQIW